MTARGPNPVLSVKDAQVYLGNISRATLYKLSAEGGAGALPVVYVTPGRRGFLQSDLDVYIAGRRRAS
jgi:predicted DNA-binding transcriptional regulator AlpA